MWEPVEVHEWLEDVWLPRQLTERVWRMQVHFLDGTHASPVQTACRLYGWHPGQRVFPWGDEALVWRTRQLFWQQYEETGAFPVFTHYVEGGRMPINETRAVAVTLEADLLAPGFIPLVDLVAGNIVIPNQCTLTVTGTPSPLEVAVMLCATGTELGTPAPEAIVEQSGTFTVTAGKVFVLEGNVPPLVQGGVLGLHVPVALLTTGAKVEGVLSLVR